VSQTVPPVRRSRAPLVFAILGIVAALIGGGAYFYHQRQTTSGRTPEQTVDAFLTEVFVHDDPAKLAADVCNAWDPQQAITRTKAQIPDGAKVDWDNIRLLASNDSTANVRARLALIPFADVQPSDYIQWTFDLVNEAGWRVCNAQPLVSP
jgi:hypothetical protein